MNPNLSPIKQLLSIGAVKEALAYEKQLRAKFKAEGIKQHVDSVLCEEWLNKFITEDVSMIEIKDKVRTLTHIDDSILILGEQGTGKELIARALHGSREGNFVAVNCSGLPDHLLESEFFGHEKGAFTGAETDKVGLMKFAANGTLFLDEIGDMPPVLQAKLLRALQERSIRPVGSNKEIPINCRVLAATNKPLHEMITQGVFRQDLLDRLSIFTLQLLSLRARLTDCNAIALSLEPSFPVFATPEKWRFHVASSNVRGIQRVVRHFQVFGKLA